MAARKQSPGQQQFPGLEDDTYSAGAVTGSRPGPWVPLESSRVSQARFDRGLEQVHVIFRDGTPWTYDGVPENIWRNFRRSSSPGKYINRILNGFSYHRGGFDFAQEAEGDE